MRHRVSTWYDRVLEQEPPSAQERRDALAHLLRVRYRKSQLLRLMGGWDQAEHVLRQNIHLATTMQQTGRLTDTYGELGWLLAHKGQIDQALTCYQKVDDILNRIEDKTMSAGLLNDLGMVYYLTGDYDRALEFLRQSLVLANELKNRNRQNVALGNLSEVYRQKGDLDRAMSYVRQALQLCQEMADQSGISAHAGNLGIIYFQQGDFQRAIQHTHEALRYRSQMGDRSEIARLVGNLAVYYLERGDDDRALTYFEQQLKAGRELGHRRMVSYALGNMGIVFRRRGEWERALQHFSRSIAIARQVQDIHILGSSLFRKAEVLGDLEQYDAAHCLNVEAGQVARKLNRSDLLFETELLHIRLLSYKNRSQAIQILSRRINTTTNEAQLCRLHDELWQMYHQLIVNSEQLIFEKDSEELLTIHSKLLNHKKAALELYQKLYEKTPKFEYQKRIEELSK